MCHRTEVGLSLVRFVHYDVRHPVQRILRIVDQKLFCNAANQSSAVIGALSLHMRRDALVLEC